ncbi:hypothetical protein [Tenacibaculum sp. M341]|uniref:hypothetical protein n=1 Tax=Tenacibaculum sp. M341 TaxID=2530339 RepID=UPI0010514AC4|nr:hypothetical protein [Tenacibaculum sp. M341]TCI91830.1 hypothetical protein EYW44_09765 [Tenacibaculum sp. M341]
MKRLLIITLINAFALLLTSCEKEDELVLDENLIEQEAIGNDDAEEIEHIKKIMKFVKSKSNRSGNEVPPACPKGGSPDSNGHCGGDGDPDEVNEDGDIISPEEGPGGLGDLLPILSGF